MKKWILAAGLLTCASLAVMMRSEAKQLSLADIQRECEIALRANTVEALQYFLLRYPPNRAYRNDIVCYAMALSPTNFGSEHDDRHPDTGFTNGSNNGDSGPGDNGSADNGSADNGNADNGNADNGSRDNGSDGDSGEGPASSGDNGTQANGDDGTAGPAGAGDTGTQAGSDDPADNADQAGSADQAANGGIP
jgi:hypothetical protein